MSKKNEETETEALGMGGHHCTPGRRGTVSSISYLGRVKEEGRCFAE